MTRVIDISLGIDPTLLVFPGNPTPQVLPTKRIARGDSSNVSELRLGSHTGTHVDAPAHFLEDGTTVDSLPLEVLIGEAFVADLSGIRGPIGTEDLEGLALPEEMTRLLLKTRNSELWRSRPAAFPDNYVSVSPEGAKWMAANGIRLVGIDFLSIEARGAPGRRTHRTLLEAGVVIVEGLDLSAVPPGEYTLICLPLKVTGGDGAPARAVLIER